MQVTRLNSGIKRSLFASVVLVSLVIGCTAPSGSTPPQERKEAEPAYIPADGAVAFEINSTKTDAGKRSWLATYSSNGRTARFVIEFNQPQKVSGGLFSFGKGRFIAENGSDAGSLIATLAKALEARKIPKKVARVANLPFEFASFGDNVRRLPDGSFGAEGSGHWMVTKIFLAAGEGEVYLNLNPMIGKGEFTIKDPDYGDIVISELAKVL